MITTYAAAESSATPVTIGMSRAVTAESSERPRPGRAKMDSTTTAPESSEPNAQPESAMPGSAAWRRAWRSSTPISDSPRARAESAKAERCAASRVSRMTWPRNPASGRARVATGSTSPAGDLVLTGGSQPSAVAKSMISTLASQKCGTAAETISRPEASIMPSLPAARGSTASARASTQATSQREHRQHQGGRNQLAEHLGHRDLQRIRGAQVPGGQAPQLAEVLHIQRLVQAIIGARRGQRLGGGLRARARP